MTKCQLAHNDVVTAIMIIIKINTISSIKKIQSINLHVFLSGSFILSFVHIYTIKPTITPIKIVSNIFNNFMFEDSGYEDELFFAIATILYNMLCVSREKNQIVLHLGVKKNKIILRFSSEKDQSIFCYSSEKNKIILCFGC